MTRAGSVPWAVGALVAILAVVDLGAPLLGASGFRSAVDDREWDDSSGDALDLWKTLDAQGQPGDGNGLADLLGNLTRSAPRAPSYEEALAMAGALPAQRIPLPATPPGPAPLATALDAYLAVIGVPSPGLPALAAAGAGLNVDDDAEAALARLVLAYNQAIALQAEAVAGLDESARLDLSGLNGESAAMRAADLVDGERMWQAADLLVRAAEDARPALASVAGHAGPMDQQVQADADPWEVLEAALGAAGATPSDGERLGSHATLAGALDSLAHAMGAEGAQAMGVPASVRLPASLDQAIAGIVQAHADGIRQGDNVQHAAGLVRAAKAAAPTLKAWGSLLSAPAVEGPDAHAVLAAAIAGRPDALAAASLGATPPALVTIPPLAPLLRDYGLGRSEATKAAASLPPQAAAALALLLGAERANRDANAAARELLTAEQTTLIAATPSILPLLAMPQWTDAQAAAVEGWAIAVAALAPALPALRQSQADAVTATQAATELLAELPPLPATPSAVPLGGSQTRAAQSPPDPMCPAQSPLSDCENDIFLEIAAGQGILVTGRGSTSIDGRFAGGDAHIVIDLGGNDVHKVSAGAAAAGLGIPNHLVTDLGLYEGGDIALERGDVYTPLGQDLATSIDNAVSLRTFAITLDVAGEDEYTTASSLAQGAARGLGTVGILWDRSGDDTYTQLVDPGALLQVGQGAGVIAGLGVLVDESGADRYEARNSLAQGVGWSPPTQMSAVFCPALGVDVCLAGAGPTASDEAFAGVGLLLDNGPGADSFRARQGQGHAAGTGTLGALLDAEGATAYQVLEPSPMYQGGRGVAAAQGMLYNVQGPPAQTAGGLAFLVDLGGDGDSYTSPAFGPFDDADTGGIVSIRPMGREARKADDAAWANARSALAIGIDSSLGDADGDGFSDLAELLLGSDPDDATDIPDDPSPLADFAAALLGSLLPEAKDTDGDRVPDDVETTWGSDPNDPTSTPVGQPDGFLVAGGAQCAADEDPECGEGGACDPGRFQCLRLLAIGSPDATTHDRAAIVSVDLGGDDLYPAPVAGDGATRNGTAGSVAIDVSGDDSYGGPDATRTQAFNRGSASLLLDLSGRDLYQAESRAQAAVEGDGVAILADLDGDDAYSTGGFGQGSFLAGTVGTSGSLALLLDANGQDRYAAPTQATVMGPPRDAIAALVDLRGDDSYLTNALPGDLDGGDGTGATPFEAQGRLVRAVGDAGSSLLAWGAFIDAAGTDQYRARTDEGLIVDQSGTKDGAGLVRNAPRGPAGPAVGDAGTAGASFADGVQPVLADGDGDGFVWLVEALLGSDPDSADSAPVRADAVGDAVDVRPSGALAGTFGENLRLPGLLISGTGGLAVHDEYVPFLVDLGGNDRYVAPNVGGASAALHHLQGVGTLPPAVRLATAFLFDVAGDDVYEPEPCNDAIVSSSSVRAFDDPSVTSEPDGLEGTYVVDGQRRVPHCPSLGGAVGGVAVLVDGGGSNRFDSRMRINVTTVGSPGNDPVAQVRGWGVTQGASLFHGAGILVTHGATNAFSANVTVLARESSEPTPTPSADAITLAQGAAWGHGLGILSAPAGGNDTYSAEAWAEAPRNGGLDAGRAWSFAQGAARSGIGILLDAGGDNLYVAPAGVAQGVVYHAPWSVLAEPLAVAPSDAHAAHLPFALLSSGPGNDTYLAGPGAQGAAADIDSTDDAARAMLVDAGGNDVYEVSRGHVTAGLGTLASSLCEDVATDRCGLAHGAAAGVAVATLVDWAGNDRYVADGLDLVQGAGLREGQGMLLDMGGQDSYVAGGLAQGGAGGVLVDASGHDNYRLARGSQGAGRFVDAGGRDLYVDDGAKSAWPQAGAPSPTGNDWTWTTGVATPPGFGVDHEGLEGAIALAMTQAPPLVQTVVDLNVSRARHSFDIIEPGETAAGTVYVFAQVRSFLPADTIRRVDILRDGALMGSAERVLSGVVSRYVLAWNTTDGAEAVPDGSYALQAVVMAGPNPGRAAGGAVDGTPFLSTESFLDVDNAPTGTAALSSDRMSPAVATSHPTLDVEVSAELGGASLEVEVELVNASGAALALRRNVVSGAASQFTLDGTCDGLRCGDGLYDVNVTVSDGVRSTTLASLPLLIDSTPPSGAIAMPGVAGPAYRGAGNSVAVAWTAMDEGSGLARAIVDAYRPDGTFFASGTSVAPGEPVAIAPVANGDRLLLRLRLDDAVGNRHDPCDGQPVQDCPAAVPVLIDFVAPDARGLQIVPALVGPGLRLGVSVEAEDQHSDVAGVHASVHGARDLGPLALAPAGLPVYATSVELPAGPPIEAPFTVDVVVTDNAASSVQAETATGFLDTMKPRLSVPTVSYDGATAGVGKPGGTIVVAIGVTDHLLSAVTMGAPSLGVPAGTSCTADGPAAGLSSAWQCTLTVPAAAADGDHAVTLAVRDAAGNPVNTTAATVRVDAVPAVPEAVRVLQAGPDFLDIEWKTSRPASGRVDYGRGQLRDVVGDPAVTDSHVVRLTGLQPRTEYRYQVTAVTEANVAASSPVLRANTTSGYEIALGVPADSQWSGQKTVPVTLTNLVTGALAGPVPATLRLQDQASPASLTVSSSNLQPGLNLLPLDTTSFPDGSYVLVVDALRGSDNRSAESPPLRIDNIEPVLQAMSPQEGAVIAAGRPTLEVYVVDPSRPDLPPLSTLEVFVDGVKVPATAGITTSNGISKLSIDAAPHLGTGLHSVRVTMRDLAGNLGWTTWSFTVDQDVPAIEEDDVAMPTGVPARPGVDVPVRVVLSDLSGVASAAIDLRAAGGSLTPLTQGDGNWSASVRIPALVPHGPLRIPLLVADIVGNAGEHELVLDVDALAPVVVKATATATDPVRGRLDVVTDSPSAIAAAWNGGNASSKGPHSLTHSLALGGLRPGAATAIALAVSDQAGNVATLLVHVQTPRDEVPPSAIAGVRASSPEEGKVLLEWDPATDDVGLGRYDILRTQGSESVLLSAGPNATTFLDAAQAGQVARYEVRAVDLGGLEGAPATVEVQVLALPHLGNARITPESGRAGQPFHIVVDYWHPTGKQADRVDLRIRDVVVPLSPIDAAQDCLRACAYVAEARLPATSTLAPEGAAIVASAAGITTSLPVQLPLVTADGHGLGVRAGSSEEAPAPAWAFLALLLFVLASRRRRLAP